MAKQRSQYVALVLFLEIYRTGGFYSQRQFAKLGFSKNEYYTAVRHLKDAGLIEWPRHRARFIITEQGERIMNWSIEGHVKTYPEKFKELLQEWNFVRKDGFLY